MLGALTSRVTRGENAVSKWRGPFLAPDTVSVTSPALSLGASPARPSLKSRARNTVVVSFHMERE
jgi:hypothetical protein